MRFLRATTPLRDGDAKRTRRSRHARRPKDALRHVRTPFRAEAARLEVDVARSARNAARFADRDRRYRLFGFSILAAVSFLVSRVARFASAGRGAKSAFDLIPGPEAFPVLWGHGRTPWTRAWWTTTPARRSRPRGPGSRMVLGTFRFFNTGHAYSLFTTPRYPPLRDRRD